MSVDVTHIVKHDFRDTKDKEASVNYALKTINLLKKNLYLDDPVDSFELFVEDGDDGEITFRLPFYDVEFSLHRECWQIESYYHYCQIVMHKGDWFWLREMVYDVARALNKEEMWHSEEYYTWNGGPLEIVDCSFEQWISFTTNKLGREIPEYDYNAIIKQGDIHIPTYEPVYHDNFADCKSKFNQLKEHLYSVGYEPIGMMRIFGYIRCKRITDGSIHFVDIESLKPMIDGTPEEYDLSFPSSLIVVKQQNKYALFDLNGGKRLTDYATQPFRKEWSKEHNNYLVINEDAGISGIY